MRSFQNWGHRLGLKYIDLPRQGGIGNEGECTAGATEQGDRDTDKEGREQGPTRTGEVSSSQDTGTSWGDGQPASAFRHGERGWSIGT
jgi:hypothetical protein